MKAFLSGASVHLRWPAWPTSQAWASCSWECSPGWTGLWRFKSNFEDKGSTILSLSLTHHYLLSSASISALYIYQTWLLRFIFSIKTCWDCFFLEKSRLEIIPDFHDWLRSCSRLKWLLVRSTIVKTTSFHKFTNAVVCLPSWMQILFRADQSEASDDQWEAGSLGDCVASLLCNAFCSKYWDFWSSPQVWSLDRSQVKPIKLFCGLATVWGNECKIILVTMIYLNWMKPSESN